MGAGQILDLRPMFTGSPLEKVLVETLQSQAMRPAVSFAIGPAFWIVGFLEGIRRSEACGAMPAGDCNDTIGECRQAVCSHLDNRCIYATQD